MKCEAKEKTDQENIVKVCNTEMTEIGEVAIGKQRIEETHFARRITNKTAKLLQCGNCKSIKIV